MREAYYRDITMCSLERVSSSRIDHTYTKNGIVLGETERFHFSTQMIVADFDVQRFIHERLKTGPGLVSASQRAQATSFDGVDRLAVFRSRPAPAGSCLLPSFMIKQLFKTSLHDASYLRLLKKAKRLSRVLFLTKALCPSENFLSDHLVG
jgi:hypothetical protein